MTVQGEVLPRMSRLNLYGAGIFILIQTRKASLSLPRIQFGIEEPEARRQVVVVHHRVKIFE